MAIAKSKTATAALGDVFQEHNMAVGHEAAVGNCSLTPPSPLNFGTISLIFPFVFSAYAWIFFPLFFLGLFSFSWRFFLTIHSLVAPLSNDNSDLFTIITLWIDRWSCISHPKFGLKIFKISKKFDIIILLDQILYLNMILTL